MSKKPLKLRVTGEVIPTMRFNVLKQQNEVYARVKRSVIDGLLAQLRNHRQRTEYC